MHRSCHYSGENINWVNLKSQIFQKKQSQWKRENQNNEWSLPLIHEYWDLEDISLRDHLVWWYSGLLHWVIYQYARRLEPEHTFGFWYQTETFKHHEKWNSWEQEKCPAPPLNLNSPVWIFCSCPISKLILKSVEPLLKMGVADDTTVVTTLSQNDIFVGQVYCKVGPLLGLKEGWLQGLARGNNSSVQN